MNSTISTQVETQSTANQLTNHSISIVNKGIEVKIYKKKKSNLQDHIENRSSIRAPRLECFGSKYYHLMLFQHSVYNLNNLEVLLFQWHKSKVSLNSIILTTQLFSFD